MSNEIRSTLLEPITPQNAVLLLIDQQEGLLARVYQSEHLRACLLGLARGAKLLGVPVVMTTALSAGSNGPQWNALTTLFPDGEIIDRTLINAWQDPRVHEAITRTGRKKVIIAGTGFDICAQFPALASRGVTTPMSSSMPLAALILRPRRLRSPVWRRQGSRW